MVVDHRFLVCYPGQMRSLFLGSALLILGLLVGILNLLWAWCDTAGGGVQLHNLVQILVLLIAFPIAIIAVIYIFKNKTSIKLRFLVIFLFCIYLLSAVRACNSPTPSSRGDSCTANPNAIFKWKYDR